MQQTTGIPKTKIGGFRAPFLIFDPKQREILQKAGAFNIGGHAKLSFFSGTARVGSGGAQQREILQKANEWLEGHVFVEGGGGCGIMPFEHPLRAPHTSPTHTHTPLAGFWFDSSISEQYPSTASPSAAQRLWPYTMDYGVPQDCSIRWGLVLFHVPCFGKLGVCTNSSRPGLSPAPCCITPSHMQHGPVRHQGRLPGLLPLTPGLPTPSPSHPPPPTHRSTGQCDTSERHPGLWEFPMWNVQDKTGATVASMDPIVSSLAWRRCIMHGDGGGPSWWGAKPSLLVLHWVQLP